MTASSSSDAFAGSVSGDMNRLFHVRETATHVSLPSACARPERNIFVGATQRVRQRDPGLALMLNGGCVRPSVEEKSL